MERRRSWIAPIVVGTAILSGCSAVAARRATPRADFFPLVPRSRWEYVVTSRGEQRQFRFIATVRQDPFVDPEGRRCRVVDEQYTELDGESAVPILYCVEGGYLHRVMSLEYRGETLEDNGLRSGELKFLPTNLSRDSSWEGFTNAYRLPDGSGYVVAQSHRATTAGEDVAVPAGHFAGCVRVDTTAVHYAMNPAGEAVGPRVTFYYSDWYAPGVGLIRTEQRNEDRQVLATIALDRFAIGAEAVRQ